MEPASSKHYKYMYCSVDEVEVISVLTTLTVNIESKLIRYKNTLLHAEQI